MRASSEEMAEVDACWPRCGPCGICGDHHDPRHHIFDAIVLAHYVGMSIDEIASEDWYGAPRSTVIIILRRSDLGENAKAMIARWRRQARSRKRRRARGW